MKTKNWICFIVVMTVVLFSEICFAFDDGDFQYWSKANIRFDIDRNWSFIFEEEFRLGDDGWHLLFMCHNLIAHKGLNIFQHGK